MQTLPVHGARPILRSSPECAAIYAPGGRLLHEGDAIRLPELGDLLERLGAEAPAFSTRYTAARRRQVLERGGLLARDDLASYEVLERPPARVGTGAARCSQPAAVVGRHPDRRRSASSSASRPPTPP